MQKETSKSIIFLVIVSVLFIVVVVWIFQQGQELNKQLAAGISFSEYEKEENGGSQVPIKLAEQAKKMILASCLSTAYSNFESLWNEECEKQGLEEKCNLPKWVADELNSENQQLKDECYKKYPIE